MLRAASNSVSAGGATVQSRPRIEVVAAVIYAPDGRFLLAQRPAGKAYEGYWEFPGGKVEPGESADAALKRELHEELGIDVTVAYPWLTRDFDYPHADVRLRFFRVREWTGALHGREAQQFTWQTIDRITVAPVLPANGPIMRGLELPSVYGITAAGRGGEGEFLLKVERSLEAGLKLIQVREKAITGDELVAFTRQVVARSRAHGARVVVNADEQTARSSGADGIHLTSARLMTLSARPDVAWCGASCHSEAELARARELQLDFVVLGPVAETPTHPAAELLGWARFSELIRNYPLPVYALGGLSVSNLADAWKCGAHGVAMLRDAWSGARYS